MDEANEAPKLNIGDRAVIINYGHLIFYSKLPEHIDKVERADKTLKFYNEDKNFRYYDLRPELVGQEVVITTVVGNKNEGYRYQVEFGNDGTLSWLHDTQLQKVNQNNHIFPKELLMKRIAELKDKATSSALYNKIPNKGEEKDYAKESIDMLVNASSPDKVKHLATRLFISILKTDDKYRNAMRDKIVEMIFEAWHDNGGIGLGFMMGSLDYEELGNIADAAARKFIDGLTESKNDYD